MTRALTQQIAAAVGAIHSTWPAPPRVGMILGTGLGALTNEIEVQSRLSYDTIPHFHRATVLGHRGQLVCGTLCGTSVVRLPVASDEIPCALPSNPHDGIRRD